MLCGYARVATPAKVFVHNRYCLDLYTARYIHTHKFNCNVDANVGHKLQSAGINKTSRGLRKIHFRGYTRVVRSAGGKWSGGDGVVRGEVRRSAVAAGSLLYFTLQIMGTTIPIVPAENYILCIHRNEKKIFRFRFRQQICHFKIIIIRRSTCHIISILCSLYFFMYFENYASKNILRRFHPQYMVQVQMNPQSLKSGWKILSQDFYKTSFRFYIG